MRTALMTIRSHKAVAKKGLTLQPSPAVIPAELASKMKSLAKYSLRKNTRKANNSDWRLWKAWAESTGNSVLPAHHDAVAAWLASLSDTRKFATLKRYLSTICARHTREELPFNREARTIRAVMAGHRQTKGSGQRKAEALTAGTLKIILATMSQTKTVDVRDRALLMLGVATGLCRSELTCLRWQQKGEGRGVIARAPQGMLISLDGAKTGRGEAQTVTLANMPVIAALEAWVKLAGVEAGSLPFRSVDRHGNVGAGEELSKEEFAALTPGEGRALRIGLSDKAVSDIVKSRCASIGLKATDFSGHSLRSGMLQSAAGSGVDKRKLMRAARH